MRRLFGRVVGEAHRAPGALGGPVRTPRRTPSGWPPRRLRNRMDCSPRRKFSSSSRHRGGAQVGGVAPAQLPPSCPPRSPGAWPAGYNRRAQLEQGVAALPWRGTWSSTEGVARPQHQQGAVLDAAVLGHLQGRDSGGCSPPYSWPPCSSSRMTRPQVVQGGENCRAGADDHLGLPPADALPLVVPLPRPQGAVLHRHLPAEVGGEDVEQLGGEDNLGHQHQGGPAPAPGSGGSGPRRSGSCRSPVTPYSRAADALPGGGHPVQPPRTRSAAPR